MILATTLKLFRVKHDEIRIVLLTFLLTFLFGAAINFVCSISLAFFLAEYPSYLLPYVYMGVGITTFSFGSLFSYFQKTVPIGRLWFNFCLILTAVLVVFWLLLVLMEARWISFALLIGGTSVILILESCWTILVNQLFTLQQGKRLFGLMGAGIALGGIPTGFSIHYLIQAIGRNHILLLTAFILFLAAMTQLWIKKNSKGRLDYVEKPEERRPLSFKRRSFSFKGLKNKRYIVFAFLISGLSIFTFCAFDLLFNTEVKKKYPDENEMAGFFGVLYASYDIVGLLAGSFLFRPILERFGVIFANAMTPAILGFLLICLMIANVVPFTFGLVFPILVTTSIMENMFRSTISEQATLLFFQPLKPTQRVWAQAQKDMRVIPMAILSAGVFLVIVDKFFTVRIFSMSLVIIGLCLAGIAVILALRKGYLQMLVLALTKRELIKPDFVKLDRDSLNILKAHLKSQYADEVIYSLQTIEKIDTGEFIKTLQETIHHPLPEVRKYVLAKVDKYGIDLQILKELCATEKDADVLSKALSIFGKIAKSEALPFLLECLKRPDASLASSAMATLIKYGDEGVKKETTEQLVQKTKSAKVEDRLLAADVLKLTSIPMQVDLLLPLLSDPNLEVRQKALSTAAQLADARLYPALLQNLEVPHLYRAACDSLVSQGSPLIDYIASHFDQYSLFLQIRLTRLLGFMDKLPSIHFLKQQLSHSNPQVFHEALLALRRHGFKAAPEEEQLITTLMERENENILKLYNYSNSFRLEKPALLHDLICREIELAQDRCFMMLTFLYPDQPILVAMKGLRLNDEDMISYATEVLVRILLPHQGKELMPQLLLLPYLSQGEACSVPNADLIAKFLDDAPQCCINALASAAILTIGASRMRNLTEIVLKYKAPNDPFLDEIKPLALKMLNAG